jgi:hypothetical protein
MTMRRENQARLLCSVVCAVIVHAMTRNQYGDLEHDVRAALPRLPEMLTRRDVCEAIGYEPNRGSLYRILQELVQEGSLRMESHGEGQRPATYRKTGVHAAPGAG